MHDTALEPTEAGRPGLTRRQVLARGAAGGAVLWAVPTLQIIGATAADAASGPVVQPPPAGAGQVDPPALPTQGLPSRGFAVLDGADGAFVVTIEGEKLDRLGGISDQDMDYLRAQRSMFEGVHYRQPTSSDLALFRAAGDGFGTTWLPGADGGAGATAALFIALPNGYHVRTAVTFDGSLQTPGSNGNGGVGNGKGQGAENGKGAGAENGKAVGRQAGCGDGDKYTSALVRGQVVYFVTTCDEPDTGEV